jgi:hypothetical protein
VHNCREPNPNVLKILIWKIQNNYNMYEKNKVEITYNYPYSCQAMLKNIGQHSEIIILFKWAQHHTTLIKACARGLDLMIVSSLCLINSESFQGFCHFHLNCSNHWWWLLFHLQSFPACPIDASLFIDNSPMGIIWK